MEPNYIAPKEQLKNDLSSTSFSSAQRRLMVLAGLGTALAAQPNLPAMDAFSLTSSVQGRTLTYTLSSKNVPTLGNCYLTALEFVNNSSVTWTSIPSGWSVATNGNYSELQCTNTNIIGNSVFTFTLESATGGFSLRTNGAALGYTVFRGTNTAPSAGFYQFNCLIPDNSSTNLNPASATTSFNWPCEVVESITPTNVSFVANTDMRVQLQTSTNLISPWSDLGSPRNLTNGVASKISYSPELDPQRFFRAQVLGPKQ